jgi:hypothetical protein
MTSDEVPRMLASRTLVACVALLAIAAGGSAVAREPAPLRGVPLGSGTGLRLVVADKPPFVLDVDSGRVRPIPGIPATDRGTVGVLGVGGRAAVVVVSSVYRRAGLYGVRGRGTRVSRLGTCDSVIPAADGRSVWVKSVEGSGCRLRQVSLDGRQLRAPQPFRCATTLYPGGSLGLVVNRTRVLDPATGRTVVRTRWGVLAAAGEKLVLAGPGRQLALLDAVTRAERRFAWPSALTGLNQPAVDPRGRLVALAFGDPAWGAKQALDVWLLDTETGALTRLPGMPAFVALKFTSMAWTDDGRLVLLAQNDGKDMVAVWRPGRTRLALKSVRLPERGDSGSDSFAPVG